MTFGVCGDIRTAAIAAAAGYDFAEWTVNAVLRPREPEGVFRAALEEIGTADLRYPALNVFVPGDLKITGPEADPAKLREFATTTLTRAGNAGVEVIVFGSGGARRIPDGFSSEAAHEQLVEFCAMVGSVAAEHGVTVVVEPLNRSECNVLNSVAECAALVRTVSHPAVRLLVDAYHLMRDGDSYDDIVANADILAHTHIASVPNRLAPGAEPCDFAPFFNALAKAGYDGRVSIEAKIADPEADLPVALAEMSRLAAG